MARDQWQLFIMQAPPSRKARFGSLPPDEQALHDERVKAKAELRAEKQVIKAEKEAKRAEKEAKLSDEDRLFRPRRWSKRTPEEKNDYVAHVLMRGELLGERRGTQPAKLFFEPRRKWFLLLKQRQNPGQSVSERWAILKLNPTPEGSFKIKLRGGNGQREVAARGRLIDGDLHLAWIKTGMREAIQIKDVNRLLHLIDPEEYAANHEIDDELEEFSTEDIATLTQGGADGNEPMLDAEDEERLGKADLHLPRMRF